MKIVFYFTYLLFSTLNVNIYTKNLYDTETNRDDKELKLQLVERKGQNYDQSYDINLHQDQVNAELSDQNILNTQANQRYRRIDKLADDDSLFTNSNNEQENDIELENTRFIKRNVRQQSKEPYGLVYRKGRLLGILEPYPEFYELSPYPNVREDEVQAYPGIQDGNMEFASNQLASLTDSTDDSEKDESSQNEYVRYTNDKYPMILTSFKIDKKLNALNTKREKSPFEKMKVKHSIRGNYFSDSSLKPKAIDKKSVNNAINEKDSNVGAEITASQDSDSSEKVDAIEEDLRKILDDMGLVENDLVKEKRDNKKAEEVEKRDINNEDENLEEGSNKIDIVKATHDPDRMKREEELAETLEDSQARSTLPSISQDDSNNNQQNKRETSANNIKNYQNEGDLYIRNKRNEAINENSDIMKGLEKSGELTVSGNKSPLASSENESKTAEKRKDSEPGLSISKKSSDYEKQLEENIQKKINAIKEEVKREIATLQKKSTSQAKQVEDPHRRKRENTLLEGEIKTINPEEHPEGSLTSYVRSKRNSHELYKRYLGDFDDLDYSIDVDNTQDNNIDEDVDDYSLKEKRSITDDFSVNAKDQSPEKLEIPVTVDITNSNGLTEEKLKEKDDIAKVDDKRSFNHKEKAFVTTASSLTQQYEFTSKNLEKQLQHDLIPTNDGLNNLEAQRGRRHIKFPQNSETSYLRKKRGEAVMPDRNIAYLPYRAEDDEVDEEGDEFDDDGFDDRSASIHKRDVYNNNKVYQNTMDHQITNNYESNKMQTFPSKNSIANLKSDVYEHSLQDLLSNTYPTYDPSAYIRKKRHSFDQLVALHGGGPMLHHLSSVRERNMRHLENEDRSKRNYQTVSKLVDKNKKEQQNIADLSDTDLFGALPQSYEGELSRFKRVKRSDPFTSTSKNKFT